MGLVLCLPLGASEADALARLHSLLAPGSDLVDVLRRGFGNGVAVLNLALSGLLHTAGVPDQLALRMPDAAALLALAAYALASPDRGDRGPVFAALLVASPLYWAAPIVMAGLGMNTLGVFMLYRAATPARDRTPAVGPALIVVMLLLVNGAGLALIGVLAGIWCHRGLCAGDWRLLGNARLTVLGLAGLAALTLTDRLVLPDMARFGSGIEIWAQSLGVAGWSSSWSLSVAVAVIIALPFVLALVATMGHGGGRIALILGLSWLVAASAPGHTVSLIALSALFLIWALAVAMADAGRRWLAGVSVVSLLVVLCLYATASLGWSWPALAVCAVALAIGGAGLLSHRGAWSMSVLAWMLAVGVATGLYAEAGLFDKRIERAALSDALAAPGAQPIAVLAPLSAPYWAEMLGRPVFAADDVSALCAWARDKPARPVPWLIGVPAAVSPRIEMHLLQQSPGTAKSSVIVAELRGCRAGKPAMTR